MRGAPRVAPATRFVSHAWAYPFADLLAALEGHAARPEERQDATPYYWLDLLTCNQHASHADVPSDWWSNAFRDSVASIGLTVLVLQPWSSPVPLTRSWCLVRAARPVALCCRIAVLTRAASQWEIFCSIDSGATLEVALGPHEQDALDDALVRAPPHI